jgi:hypothetical protein
MRSLPLSMLVALSAVVACGGKVVLDTGGTGPTAAGGAGGSASTATATATAVSGTTGVSSSGSTGPVNCTPTNCNVDMTGDCTCIGTCADGTMAGVMCTDEAGAGSELCVCSIDGAEVAMCELSSMGSGDCNPAPFCCPFTF